jgi:hypothetical protein
MLAAIEHDEVVAAAVHLGEAQLHDRRAQGWPVVVLLLAVAGTAGAGALAAGAGRGGGSTRGPLLPQPASTATTRESGSSNRDRRMAELPGQSRSITRRRHRAAGRYDDAMECVLQQRGIC